MPWTLLNPGGQCDQALTILLHKDANRRARIPVCIGMRSKAVNKTIQVATLAALLGVFALQAKPAAAGACRFARYFAAVSRADVDTNLFEKFVFTMLLTSQEAVPAARGVQPS